MVEMERSQVFLGKEKELENQIFDYEKINQSTGEPEEKQSPMSEETSLYAIGWCLIGMFLFYVIMTKFLTGFTLKPTLPCLIHTLTGGYCPGCGGTRAVIQLLHGHFQRSFVYHPIVLYTAVIGGWFMVSQTIERLSKGKIRIGMKYRGIYLWIAMGIVIVNCIVKNVALFAMGVDLLR